MDECIRSGADAQARETTESLAATKQAVLGLLAVAVNRHKPTQAPDVSLADFSTADMPGELRWQKAGWIVHLFLEPAKPITIRWCSPGGVIFDLVSGRCLYAPSIDDLPRSPWPAQIDADGTDSSNR